ncbi:MAG TPA: branched-chain amino acid transaminase [Chloroflexota bacterium]|nr:branched-chain amino acid transaminase [Chloroflexota bacterium]
MEPTGVAFISGEYIPLAEANVNVMTHSFNYGTGVFEGIRGYWNAAEEQVYLFRVREHYERLHESARIMGIVVPYSVDELCRVSLEVVRRSMLRQDLYLRPIAYKSGLGIGVGMTGVSDGFVLFATPMGNYLDTEHGLRCCVSSWRRAGDNAIPPRAKVTGGYANAALAKHEAQVNGYDEAIMLTDSGVVAEGSAENLFMVRRGALITPPITDNVLEGITRATLMELARTELHNPVVERTVQRTELYTADELFLCGTGAQILPVIEVDRRPVGAGAIGPLTAALQSRYFDLVRGVSRDHAPWRLAVYEPARV